MPFSALLNEPGLGAQSRDLITTQASQWAQACGFEPLPPYLPHLLTLEQLPPHLRDPSPRSV
jgi:hypothetical protein